MTNNNFADHFPGKQFSVDLTSRKASIKIMIQEEMTKLADEDEEGRDDENDEDT